MVYTLLQLVKWVPMNALNEIVRTLPYEIRVARDYRAYFLYAQKQDRVLISMGVGTRSIPSSLAPLGEYSVVDCVVFRDGVVIFQGGMEITALYDGIVSVLGYEPSRVIDLSANKVN